MAKAEVAVEELVGMIKRGERRLPEMHRNYVRHSTRVRDLLHSLYRSYPSGATADRWAACALTCRFGIYVL